MQPARTLTRMDGPIILGHSALLTEMYKRSLLTPRFWGWVISDPNIAFSTTYAVCFRS